MGSLILRVSDYFDPSGQRLCSCHVEPGGTTHPLPPRRPSWVHRGPLVHDQVSDLGDGLDEDNYPITTTHPQIMDGAGGSGLAAAHAAREAAKAASQKPNDKDTAAQPPAKKYRLTENMKAIGWERVLISNECCRLETETK